MMRCEELSEMNAAWHNYVSGEAPGWHQKLGNGPLLVDFLVNDCLRSVGQVFLCNNPITGVFVLIALGVEPSMRKSIACGVVAVFISCIFARAFLKAREASRNGQYGFNSFLIGLALPLFVSNSDDWPLGSNALVITMVLPCLSTVLQAGLNKCMVPSANCPCLTLPFNILILLFLLDSERGDSIVRLDKGVIHPSPVAVVYTANYTRPKYQAALLPGVFKGVSQVYFINNCVSGILVVTGILCYSWISGAMALVGSAAGIATSALLGSTQTVVSSGLWGYNAALTAVALCGVFFVPTIYSFLFALMGMFTSALFFSMLTSLFRPWGLPSLTLPFCLATVVFLSSAAAIEGIVLVPLDRISTPERHRRDLAKAYERQRSANRFDECKLHFSAAARESKDVEHGRAVDPRSPILDNDACGRSKIFSDGNRYHAINND